MNKNMLNIYLTRHDETEWNIENRLQGSLDSPLTNQGIKHAVLLGKRLKNIDFNAIYSSTSKRAFDTAKYIKANRDTPIQALEGLKEINFGDWEGKQKDEVQADEAYKNFWEAPHQYNHKSHNGEELSAFKQRVEDTVEKILLNHENGNILIVTHAVVIRAIMSFTMNIPTEKMWDPPFIHGTSLTLFNWDGERFHFQMVGDTRHFQADVE